MTYSLISLAEIDSVNFGQHSGNHSQSRGDGAQYTGLAVRIVTVKHRERRVDWQLQLIDGSVVLDLYKFELHKPFPRERRCVNRQSRIVTLGTLCSDCILTPSLPHVSARGQTKLGIRRPHLLVTRQIVCLVRQTIQCRATGLRGTDIAWNDLYSEPEPEKPSGLRRIGQPGWNHMILKFESASEPFRRH